jgi:hypothetical protein
MIDQLIGRRSIRRQNAALPRRAGTTGEIGDLLIEGRKVDPHVLNDKSVLMDSTVGRVCIEIASHRWRRLRLAISAANAPKITRRGRRGAFPRSGSINGGRNVVVVVTRVGNLGSY